MSSNSFVITQQRIPSRVDRVAENAAASLTEENASVTILAVYQ
jgi:uncharacterized protein (UPF0147 family)